jgi:hypothetical protein
MEMDATDFWQDVEHAAYAMDGESPKFATEVIVGLSQALNDYRRANPEIQIRPDATPDEFAMYAVLHLVTVMAGQYEMAAKRERKAAA